LLLWVYIFLRAPRMIGMVNGAAHLCIHLLLFSMQSIEYGPACCVSPSLRMLGLFPLHLCRIAHSPPRGGPRHCAHRRTPHPWDLPHLFAIHALRALHRCRTTAMLRMRTLRLGTLGAHVVLPAYVSSYSPERSAHSFRAACGWYRAAGNAQTGTTIKMACGAAVKQACVA